MELEKLGKLIDQWKGLLAGIAALLVAIVGVHKALTDLDSRTWSWPELAVAGVSIALLAIITLRTRTARLSRLLDPDALKLDPQSPERHWLAVGKHLALADNALAWRIGDWWVYGEHRHGDREDDDSLRARSVADRLYRTGDPEQEKRSKSEKT